MWAAMTTTRTHGSRRYNEVWSYGKQAEPILEKYLRLRYALMPYIYSLGYATHQTGAPYMRALFMDFPQDTRVSDIGDEYMFGPAFLVAPVTEQGATSRMVYLPAGTDWYNYWTNERLPGGQSVRVQAPIDTLPLFVRAGSIVPVGEPVENTGQLQKLAKVRVYPGASSAFAMYQDDGKTYAYEQGKSELTTLRWDDGAGKLTQSGAAVPLEGLVEVVGR
jgi:alpha-D-xyloside xylohydrolase